MYVLGQFRTTDTRTTTNGKTTNGKTTNGDTRYNGDTRITDEKPTDDKPTNGDLFWPITLPPLISPIRLPGITPKPPLIDNGAPPDDMEDGVVEVDEEEVPPTDLEDQYFNGDEMPPDEHEPYPDLPPEPPINGAVPFGPPPGGYPDIPPPPPTDDEFPDVGGEDYIAVDEVAEDEEVLPPPPPPQTDIAVMPEKKFPWMYVAIGAGALALVALMRK
jgi:hypothetical protein